MVWHWPRALLYNNKSQLLDTLIVQFGQKSSNNDQGVVLMFSSLMSCWKQVIRYFVCCHWLSAGTLDAVISVAVAAVHQVGLVVKISVMDQETTDIKWITNSDVTSDHPFIMYKDSNVYQILPTCWKTWGTTLKIKTQSTIWMGSRV